MARSVVVVGAGIGGLSAAAILAAQGCRVTVVDRAEHVGGKIRHEQVAGRPIDAGPTVMTMRWALERVFRDAGAELADRVRLEPLPVLARHHWGDGSSLDLHADVARSAEAIGAAFGRREAEGYLAFCGHGERLFDLVSGPFMDGAKPSLGGLLGLAGRIGARGALALEGHRTMASSLEAYFRDARLRQLFGRFATYVGASPYDAPATLNVIAHVERLGVWAVEGGMASVPLALASLAMERGATIRLGTHVAAIEVRRGRAVGVRLEGGELLPADAVVWNGDVAAIATGLAGDAARNAVPATAQRSLSAVTFSMVARVQGTDLARHTVFFSADYAREFEEIERDGVAADPTVYVCAQDRGASGERPAGPERLFFIINAKASGDSRSIEGNTCSSKVLAGLERRFGVSFAMEGCTVTTPTTFAERFPATSGALYGPAATGLVSTLTRARERSRMDGLYLAGGSAHPGPGVPMAATSGRLAARAVIEDLGSTSTSRSTATPGGTSTR